jgi:hypothetical protein
MKVYDFVGHKMVVDFDNFTDASIHRIGLKCICCDAPYDMFIECTISDFDYMVNCGIMKLIPEKNSLSQKTTLDCIFGEPALDEPKKRTNKRSKPQQKGII